MRIEFDGREAHVWREGLLWHVQTADQDQRTRDLMSALEAIYGRSRTLTALSLTIMEEDLVSGDGDGIADDEHVLGGRDRNGPPPAA